MHQSHPRNPPLRLGEGMKWYAQPIRPKLRTVSVAVAERRKRTGRAAALALGRTRVRAAAARLRNAFAPVSPELKDRKLSLFPDGAVHSTTAGELGFQGVPVHRGIKARLLVYDDPPEGFEIPGNDEWIEQYDAASAAGGNT